MKYLLSVELILVRFVYCFDSSHTYSLQNIYFNQNILDKLFLFTFHFKSKIEEKPYFKKIQKQNKFNSTFFPCPFLVRVHRKLNGYENDSESINSIDLKQIWCELDLFSLYTYLITIPIEVNLIRLVKNKGLICC